MNIDLYLNLKSVLNIYDEYQTKFKECEEKLSEKKSQDDKHYYDYLEVGDPQQLNPVILLDEMANQKLRKKYHVAE
uniref:hypothetical protein n=1 Tax=uncultured Clostridium sp. TaxID=59620 RepID=UPI00272DD5BF